LRRRIKKAELEAVLNDPKIKICNTFQDLVEQYTDDDEPVRKNPNQRCIWTPGYRKMIEELSKEIGMREKEDDE